ncbi:uncharacterized protein LOC132578617 [Heteronotia binoei]|uniref:uncharacterized protein LOC132578617 n=1 Tax=Heteronotia binoei TaxID=13085 RepID=UPI00292EDE0D|nr:uncharacterized protein LOC132578617 [Heteronotia binoei]
MSSGKSCAVSGRIQAMHSEAAIFSWEMDICSLEISCNSGTTPGPTLSWDPPSSPSTQLYCFNSKPCFNISTKPTTLTFQTMIEQSSVSKSSSHPVCDLLGAVSAPWAPPDRSWYCILCSLVSLPSPAETGSLTLTKSYKMFSPPHPNGNESDFKICMCNKRKNKRTKSSCSPASILSNQTFPGLAHCSGCLKLWGRYHDSAHFYYFSGNKIDRTLPTTSPTQPQFQCIKAFLPLKVESWCCKTI